MLQKGVLSLSYHAPDPLISPTPQRISALILE